MTQHEKMIPIPVVHASLPVWDTSYDLTKLIRYILTYWKRSKEDNWKGVLYSIFALVCRPVSCFLVPSTGADNSYCRWSPAYACHVLTNVQVKQPLLTDMNLYADFFFFFAPLPNQLIAKAVRICSLPLDAYVQNQNQV